VLTFSRVLEKTVQSSLDLVNSERLPRSVILPVACPRPIISEVGNPVLWVATTKILINVKEQKYFLWSVREDLFCVCPYPLHGVMWHKFILSKSLESIPVLFYWRYSMCFSYCVIYLLPFCLPYETVMINLCNIQFYMLLIFVSNLVSHIKERI